MKDFDSWARELANTVAENLEDQKPEVVSNSKYEELEYPCRSCGEKTAIYCHIDDFDPYYHYCGRSPRCCP